MKGVVAEPGAKGIGAQVPHQQVHGITRSVEWDMRPGEPQQHHHVWLRVGCGQSTLQMHPYALHLGSSVAHDLA